MTLLSRLCTATALLWMGVPPVTQAQASAAPQNFNLPSGHLGCGYDPEFQSLRCDVDHPRAFKVPRPAWCRLDYGGSLDLSLRGRPAWGCAGDTVIDTRNPVLGYGKSWAAGGFECASSTGGVRCTNPAGHGFTLSRRSYSLF